jgi:hypothetical protein
MEALLTLNVIGLSLLAWACIVWIVPSYATSHLRYRLWRLRDELVDDIRAGKFDDDEQPRELVAIVESVIERAAEFSALNVVLLRLSVGRRFRPPHPLKLDKVSDRDRERLEQCLEGLLDAVMVKSLLGTPSGWLMCVVLFPVALLSAITTRGGKGPGRPSRPFLRRTRLRAAGEVDPLLLIESRNGDRPRRRRSLYQHV